MKKSLGAPLMIRQLHFLFSILLFAIPGYAQVETDSTSVMDTIFLDDGGYIIDSVAFADYINDSIRVADSIAFVQAEKFTINIFLDYGKLFTIPSTFETKGEAGIYLKFNRKWGIGGEAGYARLNPQNTFRNADVNIEGYYYGGFLYYFVNLDLKSAIFLGGGYSLGFYEDDITYVISNGVYGESSYNVRRENLTASWASFRLGSEQRLMNNIYLGALFEVRYKIDNDVPIGIHPIAIPGFGTAESSLLPALNLYVKLSI